MELTALTREDVRDLADNGRVFAGGEEYAKTGMIFRFSVTPGGISARVHGSSGDYTVTVTPQVKSRCTCPYDGAVCKHIIAALLHYLSGDYAQIGTTVPGVPTALEQTLTEMPDADLRALVLRLVRDNTDVRRALLENVVIAPALLRAQPTDAKQVKVLKKAVDKAFKALDGRDYEYDETEVRVELGFVFDAVLALNPDDQTDILWHIVEKGDKYIGEYELDTEFLEQAIGLYGLAVSRLSLPSGEIQSYLDMLMECLHWTMCEYGDVSEALHDALNLIATAPDDARYVIRKLENSEDAEIRDWAISLYRKTGDDAGYLKARQASLSTEAQHLELADFFTEKGQFVQALATLEAYVAARNETTEGGRFLFYRPDPATGRGEILRRLIAHYTKAQDAANLCRILMAQARQEGVTLNLYKQIQTVAENLGTWPECRPALLTQSHGLERARIYLYERDWTQAIEFARLPGTEERVQALIADAVKEPHPDEAIALYDALVQSNIQQFNRKGYHAAARYASEVKSIYLNIAHDTEMAALYIADIRREHARRPALREEFAGL
jgi:hypothetical protein